MKIQITDEQRKALLDAGFPRQTIYKWLKGLATPRAGNRYLWKIIIGKEYPLNKRNAKKKH